MSEIRAGPKREVTAEPLDLSKLPRGPRSTRAIAFIEAFLKVPKGHGAKRFVKLRPWQCDIIRAVLKPGVRQGLVALPRGNGKSTLCAMLAIYALFADRVEGAQVLIVASDERQSRIILGIARRMIELSPRLAEQVQLFQDRIYIPATDSVMTALPGADPGALQGWDPSFAVVDELHVVKEESWDAMALAAGKRERSLVLAISTAADSKDSVMWRLVDYGRAGDDPAFAFVEFAAPEGDIGDERGWALANPALGDFLALDALRATYRTTRPEVFARYRLNRWLAQTGSWLPWDAWEEVADPERIIDPHEPVTLGFDGSISDDSTALIGCTVTAPHHLFTVSIFEKDDEHWRVPRADVTAAVAAAFEVYNVVELAADPWHWQSEIQAWADRHSNVIEWPTNAIPRMAPATDRLRTAVLERSVSHDGSEALARHVRNAVVKSTSHGDVIVKDRRGSPRKIDGCVSAIVAHDRAIFHATRPKRGRRMVVMS